MYLWPLHKTALLSVKFVILVTGGLHINHLTHPLSSSCSPCCPSPSLAICILPPLHLLLSNFLRVLCHVIASPSILILSASFPSAFCAHGSPHCHSSPCCRPSWCQVHAFVEDMCASHSTDLQQRAYELKALLQLPPAMLAGVLPLDGSCEDVEVRRHKTQEGQ